MRRFRFRLQRVLELKESLENQKRDEIAMLYALLNEKEREIKEGKLEVNSAYNDMRSELEGNIDVSRASLWVNYIDRLWERIHMLEDEREKLNSEIEERRKELFELMKERKTLEKLKERQYREYAREADRQERLNVDEMATIRFVHKKINGEKG